MNASPSHPSRAPKPLSNGKKAFLAGTLLLTATGLICRFLGFFYRIYMSRAIGAEGLGLYNMVHTLFNLSFAVCAGSIQTALSQYIAAHRRQGKRIFITGLLCALGLSTAIAWLLYAQSSPIASYILLEPRCAPYIPLIALSVPFAAVHACINGYYYGMQKARVPAFSQVAEQVIRMIAVFLIARILLSSGREITLSLAVYGHVIGEAAASGFSLFCLGFFPPESEQERDRISGIFEGGLTHDPKKSILMPLMALALPLMGSRLVLNLLGSAEAVLIPNRLVSCGLTNSEALSIYGVLTSMALPFVLFPSAITNSMAVLLLPSAAQAQSDGNQQRISSMISLSLRYSCYMGILCIGIFTLFGMQLGFEVFQDKSAGLFITILSWLCPFMYLATTLGSILNGLGKTASTFLFNTTAMIIRLGFVIFGIPAMGIYGYLLGMLLGELALAFMNFLALKKLAPVRWDCTTMVIKPSILLVISIGIYFALTPCFKALSHFPAFIQTLAQSGFVSLCYLGLLLLFHLGKKQG